MVYDDGSSDNTSAIAKSASATVIRGFVKRGYDFAIKSLFHQAKEKNVDIVITLDSDGQHNPDDIPLVIDSIVAEGSDIVIGSRFLGNSSNEKMPSYRSIGIKTITRFTQRTPYGGIIPKRFSRIWQKCDSKNKPIRKWDGCFHRICC